MLPVMLTISKNSLNFLISYSFNSVSKYAKSKSCVEPIAANQPTLIPSFSQKFCIEFINSSPLFKRRIYLFLSLLINFMKNLLGPFTLPFVFFYTLCIALDPLIFPRLFHLHFQPQFHRAPHRILPKQEHLKENSSLAIFGLCELIHEKQSHKVGFCLK